MTLVPQIPAHYGSSHTKRLPIMVPATPNASTTGQHTLSPDLQTSRCLKMVTQGEPSCATRITVQMQFHQVPHGPQVHKMPTPRVLRDYMSRCPMLTHHADAPS